MKTPKAATISQSTNCGTAVDTPDCKSILLDTTVTGNIDAQFDVHALGGTVISSTTITMTVIEC